MPDEESNRELARRIDAKDVPWFRDQYQSGELAWLEKRLGADLYREIGDRIERDDLGWVGTTIGTLGLAGFNAAGPLLDRPPPAPVAPVILDEPPPPRMTRAARAAEAALEDPGAPKRSKKWLVLPLLLVLAAIVFGVMKCGADDDAAAPAVDLMENASKTATMTKWSRAVEGAGLTDTLKGPGPFTVFAPTDAAFDKIGAPTFGALLADKEALKKLVNYHVVPASLRRADLPSTVLATVEGSTVKITVDGDTVQVNDAIDTGDTVATNGVLHSIDKVLVPPGVDLAALGRRGITAAADEQGALTLSGRVGSQDARTGLTGPLQAALPGRVQDQLSVEASAPTTDLVVDLIGRTREQPAAQIRAAFAAIPGLTINDRLEVVPAPKLEIDINALLQAEPIQFDSGSSTIRSASQSTLDKVAALLKATPTGSVLFEGHTDSAGNAGKNKSLSEARAAAVKAALVKRGIAEARLGSKGYGSERPIADNRTAQGRQNRRVEALVTA